MIRVVARHVAEADGVLVGDFPPSEIPALMDLFNEPSRLTFITDGDGDHPSASAFYADADDDEWTQFVVTDASKSSPRLVLELLFGSWGPT